LGDKEAVTQVLAAKDFKPDVCWHGNTTASVFATVRDAVDNGLGCDWIINNWGFDENLIDILGDKAEAVNVAGPAPSAFYGADVPGMDKVKEYAEKIHPKAKKRLIRTVQAWGNVLLLTEALKRADKAGDLSGEGILTKGFETLQDFDVGLGFAPVTYTSKDHRGAHAPRVYFIKGGTFELLAQVNVKDRWPDKWDTWIGY
jgi:branched-chain amino acid transport system substrate-binding protein